MNCRKIGNIGEHAVAEFLINKGYEIVEKNYTIRGGEIDIIAKKDDIIAIVEVKTRKNNSLTSGFDSINKTKKLRIFKTARQYFLKNNCDLQPRFDVAVVVLHNDNVNRIDYIENAYDMSDTNIFF